MKHDYTCTDGNITLYPLSESDSELYRQLRNQEQNRNCFLFSGIITEEAQQQWYADYLEKPNDYMFSIYNQKGQFLGGAALYDIAETSAEFGRIIIDKTAARKKGIGCQVLLLLCALAKEQLHLNMLHLEVFEDNLPAYRTYEKAGFQPQKRYPSTDNRRILVYMEKNLEAIL